MSRGDFSPTYSFDSTDGGRSWGLGEATAGDRDEAAYIRRVDQLANLLDNRFGIMGFRFGWDSVIGLVPGIGDTVTTGLSLVIMHHAWKLGAPAPMLAKMMRNVAIDFAIGAVPLAGDVFDAAWKANRRNVRLLKDHLDSRGVAGRRTV